MVQLILKNINLKLILTINNIFFSINQFIRPFIFFTRGKRKLYFDLVYVKDHTCISSFNLSIFPYYFLIGQIDMLYNLYFHLYVNNMYKYY